MRLFLSILCIALLQVCSGQQKVTKQLFDFQFEGHTISGVLDSPSEQASKGIVLIVHGSGTTNAVEGDWQSDVRATMLKAGYSTYMWDKMGCGKSEGTFNYNQTVQNSAEEVITAIQALQQKGIPGSDHIGLWGISRAGWINPIVINQYKDIQFWISVSGVSARENFFYLLQHNLRIDGVPQDSVELISQELLAGYRISHEGGTYEAYLAATPNLQENAFWKRFVNGGITKAGYEAYQPTFMKQAFDQASGLPIYIEDFDQILSKVNCPVLALFGEDDKNVDWQETATLYQHTLAPNTELTIQSFQNCNHNLFQCNTGGFYEFEDDKLPWNRCDGFLEAMYEWLVKR